jgi:peptidoglycan/LPS O-acetylase OafA/YrhL
VQLQLESRQISADASPQWRVVHLLMPTVRHHTLLDIQSGTYHVAGDSRNLGVMVTQLQVERLPTSPWQMFLVVCDYWLLIGAAWLWLWRGRWVGVGVLLFVSSVYLAMLLQETASGFANPSLWLDHNSRSILSALMVCFAWVQRGRRVVALAPSGRRFGLDVMRAVAIVCVVIAHSTPLFFEEWNSVRDIFKWFVNLGTIGVDIFFALSGYLIGAILWRSLAQFNNPAVLKRFLMRRWLRTLPAAYVSAIVIWFIAAPKNILDYLASILFVGAVNPFRFSYEMNYWWSLSIEELFYVLFPIVLFGLMKKLPPQRAFLITIGIVAGIAFISRMLLIWYLPYSPIDYGQRISHINYASLDSMVWGIILQLVRRQRADWFVRLSNIGFAPGAIVFLTGVVLLLDPFRWELATIFFCHIFITVGAVLMIPAFESINTLGWTYIDRIVSWIALISYSLYLYNCIIGIFAVGHYGYASSWGMLAHSLTVYFGLTVILSALSYYLVEAPVLRWRDAHFPDQQIQNQRLS